MAKRGQRVRGWVPKDDRLFTLEVCIIGGPMTEKLMKKNKVICRTFQILGDQTLEDLHYAIFDAFDREDQPIFEFQVGGKGPMDPKAKKYVLSGAFENPIPGNTQAAGDVARASVGSLGLKKGDAFGYWFDFGDDWWHQINVMDVEEKAGSGEYPKVTKRAGESPPQYVDWDEEE
jgi:hypothetical protein